jgi:hypothetical protein
MAATMRSQRAAAMAGVLSIPPALKSILSTFPPSAPMNTMRRPEGSMRKPLS